MDQGSLPIPPAILAALITSFAAVICVPLINRLLIQHYDKRVRLTVTYNVSDAQSSSYVIKLFGNIFDLSLPEIDRKIRSILSRVKGYIKFEIVNEGSASVKNITLTADSEFFIAVIQVEGLDETYLIDSNNPFRLGDLQPKLKKTLHLFVDAGAIGFGADNFLRKIHVSADHVDHVKYVKGNLELVPVMTMLKRMQYAFYFLLCWFLLTSTMYIPQIFRSYIH